MSCNPQKFKPFSHWLSEVAINFQRNILAGDGIRSQASEKEEVDEDDEAAASFI